MPRFCVLCCLAVIATSTAPWARAQDSNRAAILGINVDGSGMRKLVQMPEFGQHGSPRWSHDGKRLAFDAIHRDSRVKKLYVVNVDGSGLQEVGDAAMP